MDSELDELRAEIRRMTEDLIRLLSKRLEVARRIGMVKMKHGLSIVDARAEDELRSHIMGICDTLSLDKNFVNRILNLLFAESARVQESVQGEMVRGIGVEKDASNEGKAHGNGNGSADSRIRPVDVFLKARMLEGKGREIIHLEIGEPRLDLPSRVKHSLMDAVENGRYHYTENQGIEELRNAIVEMLKTRYKAKASLSRDEVIVTPGGRFAIYLAMLASLKPGDEVIVVEPAWPAYVDIAEFLGAKVRRLSTRLEDGWDVDVERLEAIMNGSTRMIILNYPNNPTGKIISKDTLDAVLGIARSKGIIILSDEVYADLAFKEFTSVLSCDDDNTIMVSSFSKGPSMTGFRIGYAVASKQMIREMSRLQSMMLTCVAEPIQYSALGALSSMDDVKRNAAIIKSRLDLICTRLMDMPVSFYRPDGAMYVFARVDVKSSSMKSLFDKLLERGVAVAPGSGFGACYDEFIRISAGQDEMLLSKGLDVIKDVLEEMKGIQG